VLKLSAQNRLFALLVGSAFSLAFALGAHAQTPTEDQEVSRKEAEKSVPKGEQKVAFQEGALIAGVWMPDSPAKRIGLEKGDVITSVDDTPIKSGATLKKLLKKASQENRTAKLDIVDFRTGNTITRNVRPRNGWIGIQFAIIKSDE
jgi:S1-C subfamily serine protease